LRRFRVEIAVAVAALVIVEWVITLLRRVFESSASIGVVVAQEIPPVVQRRDKPPVVVAVWWFVGMVIIIVVVVVAIILGGGPLQRRKHAVRETAIVPVRRSRCELYAAHAIRIVRVGSCCLGRRSRAASSRHGRGGGWFFLIVLRITGHRWSIWNRNGKGNVHEFVVFAIAIAAIVVGIVVRILECCPVGSSSPQSSTGSADTVIFLRIRIRVSIIL